MTGLPVPFTSSVMTVEAGWIDYNGHLNMAYYNVLFDRAHDEAGLLIGLGQDYLERTGRSFFTAEAHLRYLREIGAGERVVVDMRLLEADGKRLRWWQEMWAADRRFLSATSEVLVLHVDMAARKVVPFPPEIAEAAAAWTTAASASRPVPDGAGRGIALAR